MHVCSCMNFNRSKIDMLFEVILDPKHLFCNRDYMGFEWENSAISFYSKKCLIFVHIAKASKSTVLSCFKAYTDTKKYPTDTKKYPTNTPNFDDFWQKFPDPYEVQKCYIPLLKGLNNGNWNLKWNCEKYYLGWSQAIFSKIDSFSFKWTLHVLWSRYTKFYLKIR